MSKASFKNHPPTPAPEAPFAPGDWVMSDDARAWGVVKSVEGNVMRVTWPEGESSVEAVNDPAFKKIAPTIAYQNLKDFAEREMKVDADRFDALWRETNSDRGIDLESLDKMQHALAGTADEPGAETAFDIFSGYEEQEEQCLPAPVSEAWSTESTSQEDQSAPSSLNTPETQAPESSAPSEASTSEPIRTEAGLIDPETGENIDPSFIFRKFGWTEMPALSKDSSPEEIAQFEAKLDQVVDRVCSYRERTARWTAANELRCKPYNGAADFYEEQFIRPMARALAPHRLKTFQSGKKKGQYNGKTMALCSGAVSFRSAGGWKIFDALLVKKHIAENGIEKFKAIDAEVTVTYDYNKLLSALNSGLLKDVGGTRKEAKDELAKVSVVSPKAATQPEESQDA
ncbi:MAG: hypothetical protein KGL39_23210 [Patescibacteria group bacterium]|nr:hypothetical protein [Patescibacteria group bacterium]